MHFYEIILITIVTLLTTLFAFSVVSYKKKKQKANELEQAKFKMLSELTEVYEVLSKEKELFDFIDGYEKAIHSLERTMKWLEEGIYSEDQFQELKLKFKKSQQALMDFWETSLKCYAFPYFNLNPKYFGKIEVSPC